MKHYLLESGSEGPAYIYLKEIKSGEVAYTDDFEGELVDFDKDGKPLGTEILNPEDIPLKRVLLILEKLENFEPVKERLERYQTRKVDLKKLADEVVGSARGSRSLEDAQKWIKEIRDERQREE